MCSASSFLHACGVCLDKLSESTKAVFLAGISTHLAHPAPLLKHQRVLAGQLEDAEPLHADWMAAWRTFGGLPELFDAGLAMRHPLQRALAPCPLFVSEHAGTCVACRHTLCGGVLSTVRPALAPACYACP